MTVNDSSTIRMTMVIIVTFLLLYKMILKEKLTKGKIVLVVISIILVSIFNYLFEGYLSEFHLFITMNAIFATLVYKITSYSENNYILKYILTVIISYILYFIAVFTSALIGYVFKVEYNSISVLCIILVIYMCIYILFINIKRFKKGFSFLNKINRDTTITILIFCGSVLIVSGLIPRTLSIESNRNILLGTILIAISLFIIIRRKITSYYRNNMKSRTINVQKQEIEESKNIINKVKAENLQLAKTIHKYNHKLSSIELSLEKLMANANTEFAKEIGVTLSEVREASDKLEQDTKFNISLPKTGIVSIDNMLELMGKNALKDNIYFNVKINDDVERVVDKVVPKDKFETLLADHIKDGIIAINSSNGEYKSILVVMGMSQGEYEVSFYDTGIEFDIDTLVKLGIEQITTHKDNGGSGLGFMTTFDTMAMCNASLIIEEYTPTATDYTKSITVRFDGKNEFRIYSYRCKEIKEKLNGRKIIVKEII